MSTTDKKSGRRTLFLLIAITIAPVLASYLAYYVWKPQGGMTYGELLKVGPVPAFAMQTLDGKPASLAEFKGKWVLTMADGTGCTAACQDTLHALRQYRIAQGKEMPRIERLWLLTDAGQPSAAALAAADGAHVRRALAPVPLPGELATGFYLIDPLGNQVLRYPRDAQPGQVIKELGKILKNNQNLG